MIRVLEAISDTNIGGAGILLSVRFAHRNRNRYHMMVAIPKGSQLKERFIKYGVRVFELDGCYDQSWDVGSIPKWISLIRSFRPHLVNCHGCMSCRVAARICHVPVLIDTRHCVFPPKRRMTVFPLKRICGTILDVLSDQTIAVAHAAKKNLVDMGVPSKKIKVIINGAERINRLSMEERNFLKQRLNIPKGAIVVSIFARLEPCKDHKTFLNAAQILLKKNKNYRFMIVGDGSQKQNLEKYAKNLGISDFLLWIGFVSDVTPYFNITDINVNCSIGTETSSLALSEGMSLGIPSVVSNYGGNPYMVKDGVNGFVFLMRDAEYLASRILQISSDPTLYKRLSIGAQARFEKELNAERMTRETEALYDLLIKKRYLQGEINK